MSDIVKNFIVLIASIIVVHLIYIGYIRPEANLLIETAQQSGNTVPRELVIVIKDYEQEICFILMLWGSFLILSKCRRILRYNYLFTVDLIEESEEEEGFSAENIIEKLDTEISGARSSAPLIHTLRTALWRYAGTGNVQNLSDAIESSVESLAVRQDAENSMIRYLIWAIPSIGFIGTVRGIGEALALADQALAGDITGMTNSLGVAFNSTLVALLISIFLMFLFHQLQRLQDGQMVDIQAYCERYLLARVK
ncbi:MAG: MotA/TolQ/ExbB proton channel family protein [Desulfocapsaceae bacterium]|nr:MotA/TolQ/ExbB proton channel family protein [Desulfocapsaceae bacterium]